MATLRDDDAWATVSEAWSACLDDADYPGFGDVEEVWAYLRHAERGDSTSFTGVGGPRPDDAPWPASRIEEFREGLLTAMHSCDGDVGFSTVSQERWSRLKQELMVGREPEFWAWQQHLELVLEEAVTILDDGW